jgi:hypothetical protein
MGSSRITGADGTGKGTGIGIMIGGQSTGGPKDTPRPIGMKDMGGGNRNMINGRMGDLPGQEAGERGGMEGDLPPGQEGKEISGMEGEKCRDIREEGGAIRILDSWIANSKNESLTFFEGSDGVVEYWSDDPKRTNTPSLHYSNLLKPLAVGLD